MNPKIAQLHSYPFEKLAFLKENVTPNETLSPIALSIGEPKHAPPEFVLSELSGQLSSISQYPLTKGSIELRQAISNWLTKRFGLAEFSINPEENVLPVNGTREALFAFAQAVIDPSEQATILSPNPFYQIYEGAAILAGANIQFMNTTGDNNFLPDLDNIDKAVWQKCQLIYICSPGNPTGKVLDEKFLTQLLNLAEEFDFIIAADECYSEIYFNEQNPPTGLLEVAARTGRDNFERCIVFHSLSKRSNLPGLRSGFVAGDKNILKQFLRYRTYHGCAMPMPTQAASVVAWNDEQHVIQNRNLYREKFDKVLQILSPVINVTKPDAGFYLWPETPLNDETFAKELFAQKNVTVLPGSYLSRISDNINPGENRVRMALVAEIDQCVDAANRIKDFILENT